MPDLWNKLFSRKGLIKKGGYSIRFAHSVAPFSKLFSKKFNQKEASHIRELIFK